MTPTSSGSPGNWFARWFPTVFLKLSFGLHLLGLAALVAVPQRWALIVGVVVVNHLLIGAAGMLPRSRLLGPNVRRLPHRFAARGEIALTLDDGPDPDVTPAVLEILDQRGVKATFFCIGRRAEAHPDLLAEIVRRGHRVENHSYRHSNAFALTGPSAMAREIDRAQEVLAHLSGAEPVFFRAPAGIRCFWLQGVLAPRGLHLASWTRRGYDTVTRDPVRIVRRLTRNLAAGDVILLHDISRPRDSTGRPVVLKALPMLLDEIDARNLRVIALPPEAGTAQGPVTRFRS